MGVKGLWKYLCTNGVVFKTIRLSETSKKQLICDLMAIFFWLVERQHAAMVKSGKYSVYAAIYGGDFNDYRKRVVDFIEALRYIGIEPIFFMDGPLSATAGGSSSGGSTREMPKSRTTKARYMKNLQCMETYAKVCTYDPKTEVRYEKHIKKVLLFSELTQALRDIDVDTITCTGQADRFMAQYTREHSDEVCGILTNDTDLALMAGCPMIHIKVFDFDNNLKLNDENMEVHPKEITCKILTSEILARHFGIDEQCLPALSILSSNDFTGPLNEQCSEFKKMFGPRPHVIKTVSSFIQQHQVECMSSKTFLQIKEIEEICSQCPAYANAVRYSYLFYQQELMVPIILDDTDDLDILEQERFSAATETSSSDESSWSMSESSESESELFSIATGTSSFSKLKKEPFLTESSESESELSPGMSSFSKLKKEPSSIESSESESELSPGMSSRGKLKKEIFSAATETSTSDELSWSMTESSESESELSPSARELHLRRTKYDYFLLSIRSGLVWRNEVEQLDISRPCIHTTTLPIRTLIYQLMQAPPEVIELGQSSLNKYTEHQIDICPIDPETSLTELKSLSYEEKLYFVYYALSKSTVPDDLTVPASFDSPIDVALTCACLMYARTHDLVPYEYLESLLLACFSCSLKRTPPPTPSRPGPTGVTIAAQFMTVLQHARWLASLVGLNNHLPLPSAIFQPFVYIPLHDVAFKMKQKEKFRGEKLEALKGYYDSLAKEKSFIDFKRYICSSGRHVDYNSAGFTDITRMFKDTKDKLSRRGSSGRPRNTKYKAGKNKK